MLGEYFNSSFSSSTDCARCGLRISLQVMFFMVAGTPHFGHFIGFLPFCVKKTEAVKPMTASQIRNMKLKSAPLKNLSRPINSADNHSAHAVSIGNTASPAATGEVVSVDKNCLRLHKKRCAELLSTTLQNSSFHGRNAHAVQVFFCFFMTYAVRTAYSCS